MESDGEDGKELFWNSMGSEKYHFKDFEGSGKQCAHGTSPFTF